MLPRPSLSIKGKGLTIFILVILVLVALGYGGFWLYTTLQKDELAVIVVDVAGAVYSPGVYELSEDSRVQDAIDAAGGLALEADESTINRAAPLEDGARVFIPAKPIVSTEPAVTDDVNTSPTDSEDGLMNINTADTYTQLVGQIGTAQAKLVSLGHLVNRQYRTCDED
jgi:competence protein ComEA